MIPLALLGGLLVLAVALALNAWERTVELEARLDQLEAVGQRKQHRGERGSAVRTEPARGAA